jgi:hypothetical protein
MKKGRKFHCVCYNSNNHQVYVFGTNVWNSFDGEQYDVDKDIWRSLPSYTEEVREASCTIIGEDIYIVGRGLGEVLRFDVISQEYESLGLALDNGPDTYKTVLSFENQLFVIMSNGQTLIHNL